MSQVLLAIGSAIFLLLGTLHGVLTLRDIRNPRASTPTAESVRRAMTTARLALNPRMNLWRAWLGFNLSHSLGLVVFGGALLFLSWHDFAIFAGSTALQITAAAVAAVYFALSVAFWFWGPTAGSGVGLLCFVAAALLVRAA